MYKTFISTMALGAFLALGFTACNDEQLSRNNAHDPDAENYVLPVVDTILDTTAHYDSAKSIQVLTADNAVLLDRAANTEAPLALSVGNTGFMYAAVLPEMAEQGVTFISSDPAVALVVAVPENPLQARIDGLKAGTVQVYVKSVDGQVRDSVTVNVKTVTTVVPATKVTIYKNGYNAGSEIKVAPDQKPDVTAYVSPSDANQNVTWTSSDTLVATVNAYGTITTLRIGEARIVATTSNGLKDTLLVQVVKEVHGSIWDSRYQTTPQVTTPVGSTVGGGLWFTWATDLFSKELGTGNGFMNPAPSSETGMADYVMLNNFVGVELSMGYSYTIWQGGGLGFNFLATSDAGGYTGSGFCVNYKSNKPVRMQLQWKDATNPLFYEVTLPATTIFKTANIGLNTFKQPSGGLATEYKTLVTAELTGVLFSYLAINAKIDNAVLRVRSVGLPGECVFVE